MIFICSTDKIPTSESQKIFFPVQLMLLGVSMAGGMEIGAGECGTPPWPLTTGSRDSASCGEEATAA